jgi:hypothetical protein
MRFDGVSANNNQVLAGAPAIWGGTDYTVQARVKIYSITGAFVATKYQSWNNTGGFALMAERVHLGSGSAYQTFDIQDIALNVWVHVTLVVDYGNSLLKYYYNGVEVHSAAITIDPPANANSQALSIGSWGATNQGVCDGEVKEVRIHNRVMSPTEIKAAYNGEATPFEYASVGGAGGVPGVNNLPHTAWVNASATYAGNYWTTHANSDYSVASSGGHNDTPILTIINKAGTENYTYTYANQTSTGANVAQSLIPGKKYRASIWIKSGTVNAYGLLQVYTSAWGNHAEAQPQSVLSTSSWQEIVKVFTATGGGLDGIFLIKSLLSVVDTTQLWSDPKIVALGEVAAYTPQSIGGYKWKDTTANANHGVIAGAIRVNSSPLEVAGVDNGITISSVTANRPVLSFECGTTEKLRLSANTTYGAIGDSSDSNRYMSFKDGNVGISTVSPSASYKLDVVGSIRTSATLSADNIASATGNFSGAVGFSSAAFSHSVDPGTTPSALSVTLPGVGAGTATDQYAIKVTANGYNNSTNVYGVHSTVPQQYVNGAYALYGETSGVYANVYGLYTKATQSNLNGSCIAYGIYALATSGVDSSTVGKTYGAVISNTASIGARAVGLYVNSTNGEPLIVDSGGSERFKIDNAGAATFSGNLHIKTDDAYLEIKEADGTAISYLGDHTGAGVGSLYLYNHGAPGTIQLKADAASHSFINTGGNFGVGTAVPSTTLHVAGTFRTTGNCELGNTYAGGPHTVYGKETDFKGSNNSAGDLWTVVGTGNIPNITIQNVGTTDNNNAALFFKNDTTYVGGIGMRFVDHATDESELRFSTCSGGSPSNTEVRERMTIAGNGNVGVGTNSPGGILSIGSNSDSYFSPTAPNTLNFFYNINGDTGGWINYRGYQDGITQTRDLIIGDGKGAKIATFDGSTKRVGIGIDTPSKLLHCKVTSGTAAPVQIQGYSDASTPKLLVLGTASYPNGTLGLTTISGHGYLETYGAMDLHLRPNQSTGMVVKSGGNVGIGADPGTYRLYVNGTLKVTGASALDDISCEDVSPRDILSARNITASTGTFSSYIAANGGIKDDGGDYGTNGQVLSTNGSNAVHWVDQSGGSNIVTSISSLDSLPT